MKINKKIIVICTIFFVCMFCSCAKKGNTEVQNNNIEDLGKNFIEQFYSITEQQVNQYNKLYKKPINSEQINSLHDDIKIFITNDLYKEIINDRIILVQFDTCVEENYYLTVESVELTKKEDMKYKYSFNLVKNYIDTKKKEKADIQGEITFEKVNKNIIVKSFSNKLPLDKYNTELKFK